MVPFSILGPFGPRRVTRIVVVKMASSRDHRDAVVTITRASARRVKGSRRRRDAVVVSTRESTRCARESKRLHVAATPSTRPSESFNAGGRARADKTGAEEGPEAQEARGPAASSKEVPRQGARGGTTLANVERARRHHERGPEGRRGPAARHSRCTGGNTTSAGASIIICRPRRGGF